MERSSTGRRSTGQHTATVKGNNVSPELEILLHQRLHASEGQTNGDPEKRPSLRGAVNLHSCSLLSRSLVSHESHDGEMLCSPPDPSPQGGPTWPARREYRNPLPKQRARVSTLNHSATSSALSGFGWTTSKVPNLDSQANEDVVKDLRLRLTQQGNKAAHARNRQLLEECRQYGECNNNLMETQNNLMESLRVVKQECAEFAFLNKGLMDSQERLQEECGQYEMHKRSLTSELSDCQTQNHNLMESHMEECRDFMAHERDLMASQARLMDDYKVKEAENDILKHAQQRLLDESVEQLKQNSLLVEVNDRFHVECVAYKEKLAEALPTNEQQGAPKQEQSQSEPDPEADVGGEPHEAEQPQAEVEQLPMQGSPQSADSEADVGGEPDEADQPQAELEQLPVQGIPQSADPEADVGGEPDKADQPQGEMEQLPVQGSPQSDTCSEYLLRRVLTSHTSTTEELRQALASVESLMSEARRELAARELRERRAAYEQLHNAMEGRDESALEEAIVVACRVGVDAADLEKAEDKLERLNSLSDEERAAQEAQQKLAESKRRCFQLVKQGKAQALRELLGSDCSNAAGKKSWVQWRDHSGRSLLSYAKELRAATMQECLEHLMSNDGEADPVEPSMPPEKITLEQAIGEEMPSIVVTSSSQQPLLATKDLPDECSPQHIVQMTAPCLAPWSPQSDAIRVITKSDSEGSVIHTKLTDSLQETTNTPVPEEKDAGSYLSAEELEALRLQAFKAVVKDDAETLADVLAKVPSDTWSSWQNKAAKDLLALAQERNSPASYSMMAKELGILQERKSDAFEENETVWVLLPGEVQARHATVLEDTPADATEVLVEFWDSDGPPSKINHALVMKTT